MPWERSRTGVRYWVGEPMDASHRLALRERANPQKYLRRKPCDIPALPLDEVLTDEDITRIRIFADFAPIDYEQFGRVFNVDPDILRKAVEQSPLPATHAPGSPQIPPTISTERQENPDRIHPPT